MILRLLIGIIVIFLLFKLLKGWKTLSGGTSPKRPALGEDLVEDPVCHTYVPISHALKMEVAGETRYFCSQKCLDAYRARGKA
jgi:YHS domain-containing protein